MMRGADRATDSSRLAKTNEPTYPLSMATMLSISLPQDLAAWIRSRKEEGGFNSASDVVRELIRREREKELARLEAEFDKMDREDGSDSSVPIDDIVSRVRKVRKALLKSSDEEHCWTEPLRGRGKVVSSIRE